MNYEIIIAIVVISWFLCCCILSMVFVIKLIFSNMEDFEDFRQRETYDLPKILGEIEEKEKAATRSNR